MFFRKKRNKIYLVFIFLFAFWFLSTMTYSSLALGMEKEVSFFQTLQEMMERNSEVQWQRKQVEKEKWNHFATTGNYWPTLSGQLSDQQTQDDHYLRTQSAQLNLKYNLFRSGGDRAAQDSSYSQWQRESEQLKQVELDQEQIDVILLVKYLELNFRIKVARNNKDMSEELARIESVRYQKGLIPLQEAQRSQVEKSNASAHLSDLEIEWMEVQSQLQSEWGREPQSIQMKWPWQDSLLSIKTLNMENKILSLQEIPSFRSYEWETNNQDNQLKEKFRAFFPKLDLSLNYGYYSGAALPETVSSVTLNLTVPLFDLQQHGDYRAQREAQVAAEIKSKQLIRDLNSDWQKTKLKFQKSWESAQERETSKRLAQTLYQDHLLRLQAGRSSMNDISIDQNRLAEAEYLSIKGWADVHIIYSHFCHLMGKKVTETSFPCY